MNLESKEQLQYEKGLIVLLEKWKHISAAWGIQFSQIGVMELLKETCVVLVSFFFFNFVIF